MFVLRREDGKYVSKPGSAQSYTRRLEDAQLFPDKVTAERAVVTAELAVSLVDCMQPPQASVRGTHRMVGVRDRKSGQLLGVCAAVTNGSMDTFCGLKLDGPYLERAVLEEDAKITCRDCLRVWYASRRVRESDFAE